MDNNKISFNALEDAQMVEIEVQAELLKQKEILKHELEIDNKKHMDAIMANMSKSQMYGLNDQCQTPNMPNVNNVDNMNVQNNHCQIKDVYMMEKDNLKQSFVKGKERIMMILLMLIIVLLAIGVTPSGAWYEALQTNYVETLVDVFKVCMIGFGGYLTYKLFKK